MPHRLQLPDQSTSYERPWSSPACNTENGGAQSCTECVICLESLQKNLAALSCGHVFHHSCVERALANQRTCPVCRRKTKHAVRLYISLGVGEAEAADGPRKRSRGSFIRSEMPARTASRLETMQSELDRVLEIQRMTSSHSFRLQNELVRRQQQLDQAARQTQHIQRSLDSANAELKRWQRIGTSSYAQTTAARQDKAEQERKVRAAADQMLQRIRSRQLHTHCPRCTDHWVEMNIIAGALRHQMPSQRLDRYEQRDTATTSFEDRAFLRTLLLEQTMLLTGWRAASGRVDLSECGSVSAVCLRTPPYNRTSDWVFVDDDQTIGVRYCNQLLISMQMQLSLIEMQHGAPTATNRMELLLSAERAGSVSC